MTRIPKVFCLSALTVSILIAVGTNAPAQTRKLGGELFSGTCGLPSLKGRYGYTAAGTVFMASTPFQVAGVGWVEFDGVGGGVGHDTTSWNGIVSEADITATYTVTDNCTGVLTLIFPGPFPAPSNFVITDNGKSLKFIITVPGNVVPGEMTRQ